MSATTMKLAFLRGYLGVEPSPTLRRRMTNPVTKQDQPSTQTLETAVAEILVKDAWIAPYLLPDWDDGEATPHIP